MKDRACVEFLQWCLPRLHMHWPGFRKVRGQVCKRVGRRIRELGLSGPAAYREYLVAHTEEWDVLDRMCRVTISRFYRDRGVFDRIREHVLPEVARRAMKDGEREVRCWSAGCCRGEEAYTMQILWRQCVAPSLDQQLPLRVIATDSNSDMLDRAREGVFAASSLKDLPDELRAAAFDRHGEPYALRSAFTEGVQFLVQDIRTALPAGKFHVVLCRNFVFTYFDEDLQVSILQQIERKLILGGYLITGVHERIPECRHTLQVCHDGPGVYHKLKQR
jgi:chemotaxis protein methyltransferase CheR